MKRRAFTLAETLITLVIVGIVAAITVPSLIAKYNEQSTRTALLKGYSILFQAIRKANVDIGFSAECYYNQSNGTHYNNDCIEFNKALKKNLNISKSCLNNAYLGGCTPEYEGQDTILKAQNPDKTNEEIKSMINWADFKKEPLKTRTAYVLTDGMILIVYNNNHHIYALDINGKKKPNKWGYDVFPFEIYIKNKTAQPNLYFQTTLIERGGKNGNDIIRNR